MTAAAATRPPAVAGFFYPDDPAALAAEVGRYLAEARDPALTPKAIIAPHAGYRYSAPVAASVYKALEAMRGTVSRVVLLGPSHRVPLDGLAVPGVAAWGSPLGPVNIDDERRRQLAGLPHVVVDDGPHAPEHSLEVHLPFLQQTLGDFTLLPLAVGRATPDDVADVIERCWGGPETLIVVSSDLSHYHDYESARRLDAATATAIETLRIEDLAPDSACGLRGVAGLLLAARRRGMAVVTVDVRNSGDTQGDRGRVVGYGAWAVVERPAWDLDEEDGRRLVRLARATVEDGVRGGRAGGAHLDSLPERLRRHRAAFVTLELGGRLRGCVGGVEPVAPLAAAVVRAARNAAFGDPRFPPLTLPETHGLTISVSVLSPLERVLVGDEAALLAAVTPGVDGLVLAEASGARGVFLPQVWRDLPDPAAFLARLKEKAGLPAGHWSPTLAVHRFTTEHFGARM